MSDQPSAAGGVLDALHPLLTPAVQAAGFALADASPLGDDPEADIALLEYHTPAGGGRRLLGFYEDPAARTVVAELWSPDRLRYALPGAGIVAELWSPDHSRRGLPGAGTDVIAAQRRTWRYDPDANAGLLAREIGAVVATWLAAPSAPPERG